MPWFPAVRVPTRSIHRVRLCLTGAARATYGLIRQSAGRPPLPEPVEGAEESPGSKRMRRRIMSGGGDPRESATESKPPDRTPLGLKRTARVKGCGKSAPRGRQRQRHGKPRREQDRIGATRGAKVSWGLVRWPCRSGWLLEAPGDGRPRGMAVTSGRRAPAIQNPAYRPAGVGFAPRSNSIEADRVFERRGHLKPRKGDDAACGESDSRRPVDRHAGRYGGARF